MTIELLAYKKAYMHALKFIRDDVIGVLVGKVENGKPIVEDAYPLFHSRVVAPTLESAFILIEGVIAKKNQVILGLYEALAFPNGQKCLSEISTRILEKIEKNLKTNPIALRILDEDKDNIENQEEEVNPYHYLTSEGYVFGLRDSKSIEANYSRDAALTKEKGLEAFEQMSQDIQKGLHRLIVDFDMHFEEISLDFTNQFL